MKNYISIGILIALQSGKRYTAKNLAEKFETSIKTIYRSIDTLLSAGMPIISIQGKNGGYEILKQSNLTSTFFTTQELSSFISFLKSNAEKYNNKLSIEDRLSQLCNSNLIEKLKTQSQQIVIDTGLWGHNEKNIEKVDLIKKYISNNQKIKIFYANSSTNKIEYRIIHPYTLVYKSNSWYVYAFCENKNSFRLFKLSRIKNVNELNQVFIHKNIDCLLKPWNNDYKNNLNKINIELLCSEQIICDIEDWLTNTTKEITQDKDKIKVFGSAYYSLGLIHKIMEYGNKIKVLSPQNIIDDICRECLLIFNLYNKKMHFEIKQTQNAYSLY